MNVLIIAIEDMRFGPARLPKVLAAAGFRVAALCPAENPLAHTSYLEQHFALPQAKSAFRLAAAIHRAMLEWQPHLVVPGDEQVVALLHTLLHYLGGKHTLGWPATMIDTLQRSLGAAGQRSAMLLKNDTQHLAKQIGVRVPDGREVRSLNDAKQLARRVGFPLVVKKSFGSGGTGVKICHTAAQLAAAYAEMAAGPARPVKAWLRRLLGRDWYPTPHNLWIQQQIIGMPAHYTFVAVEGRMLAGFAGLPCSTTSATGPSTVVEFGPHPEMAEASRRMVAAMGATGFLSFDFMIETGTGTAYLLECNPRPNQVSHLGNRLGVDLCAALHDGLRAGASGTATAPLGPQRREIVALFPQEWLRMCDSPAIAACHHDVPWDDAKLVMRLTATASTSPLRQRRRLRVRVPIASAARALIRPIRARFDTAY